MSKRKGMVLIIDDEEEIRESIEMLLNSEGLSTDTAANGEEGLRKIEENLYDAVLLDLMLPAAVLSVESGEASGDGTDRR